MPVATPADSAQGMPRAALPRPGRVGRDGSHRAFAAAAAAASRRPLAVAGGDAAALARHRRAARQAPR